MESFHWCDMNLASKSMDTNGWRLHSIYMDGWLHYDVNICINMCMTYIHESDKSFPVYMHAISNYAYSGRRHVQINVSMEIS